jgi:transcriptional regulator NrdR family protein
MKSAGRKCPSCRQPNSRVLDTRHEDAFTYRRRECRECGCRWTTREHDDLDSTSRLAPPMP